MRRDRFKALDCKVSRGGFSDERVCGKLIVDPKPVKIDSTSIDLHLDSTDQAKVWDIDAFRQSKAVDGHEPQSSV